MTTFYNLPIELYPFIFRYLGFVDLIRSRLVCKKWKYFCDEQKVLDLVIECSNVWKPVNWFDTNQTIDITSVLQIDFTGADYRILNDRLTKHILLSHLKRLMICKQDDTNVSRLQHYLSTHLKSFSKLEQLDLSLELRLQNYLNLTISHPNLRVIAFQFFLYDEDTLKIDANNLTTLKFGGNYNMVEIKNPQSLIKLQARIYGNFDNDDIALSPYSNLEIIHSCTNSVDPIILTQLPHLKVFKFLSYDYDHELVKNRDECTNLERSVNDLMHMKAALQRNDFNIYFDDTKLNTIDDFKQILEDCIKKCNKLDDGMNWLEEDDSEDDSILWL